ncbi:MAG: hypothetical protein C0483_07150 [Pirellula sp.]|nr:hypothetical protein [Pirellula sp.]
MAGKKFDSAQMKQFFIQRGEYVGLFFAVVLTGLLVYSAFGVAKYDKTPDDLKKEVGAAAAVFEQADSRLNLASQGIQPPSGESLLVKIKNLLLQPVNPSAYGGMEWNVPLFDTKQRRTEPKYFELTELRAVFHYGAIDYSVAGAAAAGGGNVQRRPGGEEWLTVTGLVPFEAQEAEYAKAFANALDSRTNAVPRYTLYQIQRAEVVNANPDVPVDWKNVPDLDLKVYVADELKKWAGVGREYADRAYCSFPPLTQPLPPLSNGDYGDWCTHLPEIPAAAAAPAAAAGAAAPPPVALGPPVAAPVNPGSPFDPAPTPEPAPAAAPQQGAKPEAVVTKPKYLLFRFLDFNVEPTKFYRYRVKLIIANPNYKLDQSHLETPELAQGETRETEWSKPSDPTGVPVLESYFAGEGKSVGGDQEPETTFGVKQWTPRLAADVYYEFKNKLRGAMLNEPTATVAHMIPGAKGSTTTDTALKTNVLLADFSWERTDARLKGPGSALEARTVNRPSEILVRTPRGELFIQTQLGDWPLREEMKQVVGAKDAGGNPGAPAAGTPATPDSGEGTRRTLRLN